MEVKKTKQADMTNRSSLYFLIGLNIVLLMTLLILEFTRKDVIFEPPPEEPELTANEDEVIITDRVWDEPPPPIDAPAPPEIPVEVKVVDDDVKIEKQTVIKNQDDPTPPPPPGNPGKINKNPPPPPPPPPPKDPPPPTGNDEELTRATAKRGPIYPGCEKYENSSRELYQCLNQKFGQDLANAIDPDFDLPENKPVRVMLSFQVDKNGNLILKEISKGNASMDIAENAKDAFKSVARQMEGKAKRDKGIKPAINSKDQPGPFNYSIPITYKK